MLLRIQKYSYTIDRQDTHRIYRQRRTKQDTEKNRPIFRPLAQLTRMKLSKTDVPALVTAQTGSTAILHCDTSRLNDSMENVTIKWFKRNKISRDILTLMEETVNDDKRFLAINEYNMKDWSLHIRYTQPKDEGLYQCQICTNFTSDSCNNVNITLKLEDKELPLRLSCVLINSIEAPEYIFWYHDDRMINYDLEDGATVREGRQGSELIFPKANETHTGNYSCVPSNAQLDKKGALTQDKNGGEGREKFDPHHIFNMLVLVSAFHLRR
ncbi:unnamed protein product [Phaedon cochleariae]|uniref:Ig-like domain-containing protein n=1 Tax=Phaedon cochleariae TaxID=80249 RepID=A0A9N9WXI8_PHACE|nr:unnamed protein product [Phaedon cochleariae]